MLTHVDGTSTLTVDHDSSGALRAEHCEEANYASFPQGFLDKKLLKGDRVLKLMHGLSMEMLKVGSHALLVL